MPAYVWTCAACGHANPAGIETCPVCACAATASFRDIEQARERYQSGGGEILPGAAVLREDGHWAVPKAMLKIFGMGIGMLVGWWPASR